MANNNYEYYWDSSGTSSTNNEEFYASSTGTSENTWGWRMPYYKMYLIHVPKKWIKEDCLAYSDLINKKTNTGFKVSLIIDVHVIITNPEVETRTMKDFIPLLLSHANYRDATTIRNFFAKHPIEDECGTI